jgi:hypothetical protein
LLTSPRDLSYILSKLEFLESIRNECYSDLETVQRCGTVGDHPCPNFVRTEKVKAERGFPLRTVVANLLGEDGYFTTIT